MAFSFIDRMIAVMFIMGICCACQFGNTSEQSAIEPVINSPGETQSQELKATSDTQTSSLLRFNNISELFLMIPDEYLSAFPDEDNRMSKEERMGVLAGTSASIKLETLNTPRGYLRYTEADEEGQFLSEITYFKNSQGDQLVGIHHYWKGQVEVTTAIYFIERYRNLWIDRTAGVIPLTSYKDFIPPMARDGISSDLEKIRYAVSASVAGVLSEETFLLYQLPETGKDLKVQCGKIADQQLKAKMVSGLKGASEVLVYPWLDGVFNIKEGQLLNRILEVPNALFTVTTSKENSQLLIPESKDSPANRMRLIDDNEACQERAVIGSHPDVHVREGVAHVAWFTPAGYADGFMGIWVTRGMGYPTTLYFLKPTEEDWTDISEVVLPELKQAAIDEGLSRLNPDWLVNAKVALDQLEYNLIPAQNRIHVLYPAEYWKGETAPVLIDLKWQGEKFAPFP